MQCNIKLKSIIKYEDIKRKTTKSIRPNIER